ncbi:MAG: hypothetical protein JKY29_00705 [Gammaproteobacteria bacterium]|nr:hypothetical protein [Gammaproteobacteria bacterium]
MRWFWLFILAMCVVTGGLYTSRVRTSRTPAATKPTPSPAASSRRSEPKPAPKFVQEPQHEVREELEVVQEPADEVVDQAGDEVVADEPSAQSPIEVPVEKTSAELIEQVVEEDPIETQVVVPDPEPVPEPDLKSEPTQAEIILPEPEPEPEPEPSYELLGDGTMRIAATDTVIVGSGTQADPFVLDWVTLRAIERVYNPKKGKDELPDWLDLIDEQFVRIKGNTLVPVIATTTREL